MEHNDYENFWNTVTYYIFGLTSGIETSIRSWIRLTPLGYNSETIGEAIWRVKGAYGPLQNDPKGMAVHVEVSGDVNHRECMISG